jgi:hypothetical protein
MNSKITQFKRQSVWVLLGLTVITATIYWSFWLRRQSRVLNQTLPQQPIPRWFFPISLALTILSIGWAIPEVLTDDAPVVIAIGKLLSKADLIFTIVWIFKVRNRLNLLLETSKSDKTWFGGVWTFLFGIFYVQFKLNRLQRRPNCKTSYEGSSASH